MVQTYSRGGVRKKGAAFAGQSARTHARPSPWMGARCGIAMGEIRCACGVRATEAFALDGRLCSLRSQVAKAATSAIGALRELGASLVGLEHVRLRRPHPGPAVS